MGLTAIFSPGQGSQTALPAAADHAHALGLRARQLPVTGAFHSPMSPGRVLTGLVKRTLRTTELAGA